MDYIEELARRLHHKGYSVDFDTCGHVPYTHFQRTLPYADTFLYDIKLLDPALHKRYTGVDNGLILENLKKLSGDGGKINLRLPLIGGVNATDEYIRDVIAFPKVKDASCLMTEAPAPVDIKQLEELGIEVSKASQE